MIGLIGYHLAGMAIIVGVLASPPPPGGIVPSERVAVEAVAGFGRGRYVLARPGSDLTVPSHRGVGFEQRVRRLADGRCEVTVVTRLDIARPQAPFPRVPPEPDPMGPSLGGGEAASSAIRELSAEIVAGETDQVGASAAILLWVSLNIRHQDAPPHDEGAAATLETRVASCVGRSRLAVALLRAAGLPARTVHGLVVTDSPTDRPATFTLHRFVETHVDGAGWIPSDPGDSVHLVAPSHVILAFDDAPYDPDSQRELRVTPIETPVLFELRGGDGSRPLVFRSWGATRGAGTIPR